MADIANSIIIISSKIFYGLVLSAAYPPCEGPEGREEAVEFAMRTNTFGVYGPWIPLRLSWRSRGVANISLVNVRGYDVESFGVFKDGTNGIPLAMVVQQVTICGEDLLPANANKIQFRWMNSDIHASAFRDMWAIFNVTADLINRNGDTLRILDTESSE